MSLSNHRTEIMAAHDALNTDIGEAILKERLQNRLIEHHIRSALAIIVNNHNAEYGIDNLIQRLQIYKVTKYPRKQSNHKQKQLSNRRRTSVFERDQYRCQSCQTHLQLTVDHIIPRSKGGADDLDNLQTLCRGCNSKKGNRQKVDKHE